MSAVSVVEDVDMNMHMTMDGPVETTQLMTFTKPQGAKAHPVFRVLGLKGDLIDGVDVPDINLDKMVNIYKHMGRIRAFDDIMYNAQRQGRISFYMQNLGEEATQIGSAAALSPNDTIFAQYREFGVLLWRGFTLNQAADQLFSNEDDNGKGRQMPVHYGSKELNFQTISSPLATQLPQAVGAAYRLKALNKTAAEMDPNFDLERDGSITMCYFGEGAASEGDFHAALNFSATLEVPMIFFCRNNGYAISTSSKEQYRGDGIISRAAGYGMKAIRVDGNDIFAVEMVTKAARKVAIEETCPVLIEVMTYRGGHHSTSDDSTRYRSMSEIDFWQSNFDPMHRLRAYLENNGVWDEGAEQVMKDEERVATIRSMEQAEKKKKPSISEMFTDVYADKPLHLQEQEAELMAHIAKHPDYYKLEGH